MPRVRESFEARVLAYFREGEPAAVALLFGLVQAEVKKRGVLTPKKKAAGKPRVRTPPAVATSTDAADARTLAEIAMR